MVTNPQSSQAEPPMSPSQEILLRTRGIDAKTARLMPLLELLVEFDGPSPLETLRQTLVDILVELRKVTVGLGEVEMLVRSR